MSRLRRDQGPYRCEARTTGPEIREARHIAGVSSIKLSESWGVTSSAILQYERGDRPVPCWVDRAMADSFPQIIAEAALAGVERVLNSYSASGRVG